MWNPSGGDAELARTQNPAAKLDHAKREIVASRYYELPADALSMEKR